MDKSLVGPWGVCYMKSTHVSRHSDEWISVFCFSFVSVRAPDLVTAHSFVDSSAMGFPSRAFVQRSYLVANHRLYCRWYSRWWYARLHWCYAIQQEIQQDRPAICILSEFGLCEQPRRTEVIGLARDG